MDWITNKSLFTASMFQLLIIKKAKTADKFCWKSENLQICRKFTALYLSRSQIALFPSRTIFLYLSRTISLYLSRFQIALFTARTISRPSTEESVTSLQLISKFVHFQNLIRSSFKNRASVQKISRESESVGTILRRWELLSQIPGKMSISFYFPQSLQKLLPCSFFCPTRSFKLWS